MVSGVFSVARELPRLREISSVLIRYGLGDIVRRAGVSTLLERTGQVLQWGQASEVAHLEPQQRARLALEQLGPTFVKLGQMLSTREDLLPAAWTDELNRLYSQVAPVPFDDLLPQIEQALGRSPFEVFANLEREPYAAASIAQIHRATLTSGTPVILKIRRPGIVAKVDATGLSTSWANCAARSSASLISQWRHATRNASLATLLAISTCSSRASTGNGRVAR